MDENEVRAVCRLCGERWILPKWMAEQFNADRGYECPYCLRQLRTLGRI